MQDRSCHLIAALEIEIMRAQRYARPLSLISLESRSQRGGTSDGAGFRQLNLEKRLRRIAPIILRIPDFWGRIERLGFVIALPETDAKGAAGAIQRMIATEPFQQMLKEEAGRNLLVLGAAELSEEIRSVSDFVLAAQARPAWRSVEDEPPTEADDAA